MDFYKKIIRNRKLRFKILAILRFVPDELMLKCQYRIKCGRLLNLANPQRYTEKIQWYKLYYRNPVMQQCADKYLVREYIKGKNLGHILNELYAVYDTSEQIDLEQLPEKFVLKLSNGSSTNLLCRDKSKFDVKIIQQKFRDFLHQSGASAGREWVYQGCKPVIVAERYLEDPDEADGSLRDYKILCFNGKPEYIICVAGRYTENYCHLVYDTNWTKQDVQIGESSANGECAKPDTLEQMLEIAKILSEDFPAARVDLYSIRGRIYFGEITFFPWSGYMRFKPDSFDSTLGGKFTLPEKNHL